MKVLVGGIFYQLYMKCNQKCILPKQSVIRKYRQMAYNINSNGLKDKKQQQ